VCSKLEERLITVSVKQNQLLAKSQTKFLQGNGQVRDLDFNRALACIQFNPSHPIRSCVLYQAFVALVEACPDYCNSFSDVDLVGIPSTQSLPPLPLFEASE